MWSCLPRTGCAFVCNAGIGVATADQPECQSPASPGFETLPQMRTTEKRQSMNSANKIFTRHCTYLSNKYLLSVNHAHVLTQATFLLLVGSSVQLRPKAKTSDIAPTSHHTVPTCKIQLQICCMILFDDETLRKVNLLYQIILVK